MSPVPSKLLKVPKASKKITYASTSKTSGKQSTMSGKIVSFATLDQSDDDEGIEDSDNDQYKPSNSSKKRNHEDLEKEQRARRNAPLRRSVSTARLGIFISLLCTCFVANSEHRFSEPKSTEGLCTAF